MKKSQNNGKEYENFVANLQKAIIRSEEIINQKNILIEKNKKIAYENGSKREFDIYWEYELDGIKYKTVIECKDYESNISIDKIDAFVGKLKDFPDLIGVFATKKGYQSGAKTKAEKDKIELLICREQNDGDWKDKYGNPRIKEIMVNLEAESPSKIINFEPIIDYDWAKENIDIDISKPLQLLETKDRIIIEDIENSEKYSLFDLEGKLFDLEKGCAGTFERTEKFKNAFISFGNNKFKLIAYKLNYVISKPIIIPTSIDYFNELMGVVEYLSNGTKKFVFKKGIIKEEQL